MTDDVKTPAPAKVAIALKAAGWKEVDQVPWLWVKNDVAVGWEEAISIALATKSAPPAAAQPAPVGFWQRVGWKVWRVLSSKEAITVVPILAGGVLDLIPLVTPLATNLAPPLGVMAGVVLGTLGRSLSTVMQRKTP